MFTWGAKFFFGVGAIALVAAIAYALITGGSPIGAISVGYKGGVGDHTGYGTLLGVSAASLLMGLLSVIVRDADADDLAVASGLDVVPPAQPPREHSYWGPITAFGVGCLIIGLAVSQAFFILGIIVLIVSLIEWTVLAWSDRATGDPEVNAVVRDRVLGPLEIPMLGTVIFGVIVIGLSRVLLAVSKTGSVVLASVAAIIIFGVAIAMAKVEMSRRVISGLCLAGGLAVLGGGIVGAAVGEREIEHHSEHGGHGSDHGEEGDHSE